MLDTVIMSPVSRGIQYYSHDWNGTMTEIILLKLGKHDEATSARVVVSLRFVSHLSLSLLVALLPLNPLSPFHLLSPSIPFPLSPLHPTPPYAARSKTQNTVSIVSLSFCPLNGSFRLKTSLLEWENISKIHPLRCCHR
jgi:hypothetical protein